jgi:hypothetical protein
MDQIQKIANDIANYIIDEKVVDKNQLAKKIEVQIKLAMNHHNFAGGAGMRKQVEKNERLIRANDEKEEVAKFYRDTLRKFITEEEMQLLYDKVKLITSKHR